MIIKNLMTRVVTTLVLVVGAVILLPIAASAANCNTSVSAFVEKVVDCSGGGTVNVGTVNPGNSATKTYTMSATTNSVDGFNITSSEINSLTRTGGSETIAYTSSAAAGTQGYNIKPATYSEWKKSDGTAFSSDSIVETGSVWRHSGTSGTETLTVTVGTNAATVAGGYSGTVSWTCAAN